MNLLYHYRKKTDHNVEVEDFYFVNIKEALKDEAIYNDCFVALYKALKTFRRLNPGDYERIELHKNPLGNNKEIGKASIREFDVHLYK